MRDESVAPIDPDWVADFEASLRRPLPLRFDYSFIRTPLPVIREEPYRMFDTMEDYRRWCRESLPSYMGYG